MQTQSPAQQMLTQLNDALVAQQMALLCQDGTALEQATSALQDTLKGLETSDGQGIVRSDLDMLMTVHALAQTNSWLLSRWHNWSQEVMLALHERGIELIEATC